MKLLIVLLSLFSTQAYGAADNFSLVRAAIEHVAEDYFRINPPKRPFTFARPGVTGGEWNPIDNQLKDNLLKSLGASAKHFVAFEKLIYDKETCVYKAPSKALVEVYYVRSIIYLAEDKLEICFASYGGLLDGHCIFYNVTYDGKDFHIKAGNSFDS